MKDIFLLPKRDKLPINHHPWIFSGALAKIPPDLQPGDIVRVNTSKNHFIGYGHYSPYSQIAIRLLEWNESTLIDNIWLTDKLQKAISLRRQLINSKENTAYRLIFSEADLLPGLIVDRFEEILVLQSGTPGMDKIKKEIAEILLTLLPDVISVWEKSDSEGRKMEKLPPSIGVLAGQPISHSTFEIIENNLLFKINLHAQKTGFYTDQRENRMRIQPLVKSAQSMLDVCCYTGAFSVYGLTQGCQHATLIDTSKEALEMASENMKLNHISEDRYQTHCGSAFEILRQIHNQKQTFDLVILDPPKLIRSNKQKNILLSSYKDLNLNALKLIKPGGFLATFSCSGNLSLDEFQTLLAYAAKDAQRNVQICQVMHQSSDHPTLTTIPDTNYLKGLLCRVL